MFSDSEDQHTEHLNQVIDIIIANNVTICFSKISLYKTEIKFLGHIITNKGTQPDISRTEGIKAIAKTKIDSNYSNYWEP